MLTNLLFQTVVLSGAAAGMGVAAVQTYRRDPGLSTLATALALGVTALLAMGSAAKHGYDGIAGQEAQPKLMAQRPILLAQQLPNGDVLFVPSR